MNSVNWIFQGFVLSTSFLVSPSYAKNKETEWGEWEKVYVGTCTATCGKGTKLIKSYRQCNIPEKIPGETSCFGPSQKNDYASCQTTTKCPEAASLSSSKIVLIVTVITVSVMVAVAVVIFIRKKMKEKEMKNDSTTDIRAFWFKKAENKTALAIENPAFSS